MGYDFFLIKYKKGKYNATIDALSKNHNLTQLMVISHLEPTWLESLEEEDKTPPEMVKLNEFYQN